MPIATVLYSVLSEDLDASKITGEALHGLFFAILAQEDKELAGQLHKAAGTKPFTLALLNWRKKRKFKGGEELRIRVTFLDDSLFMKFARASMNPQVPLELQKVRIVPTMINLSTTDKGLWTGQQKWEEIYDSAGLASEIVLQFATPTAFRQRDMDVPLPIPKLVFGSYLKRWKEFSSIQLHPDLPAIIEDRIAVVEPYMKPAQFFTGKARVHGFVGKCKFRVMNGVDQELIKQINALADFAFYSGTGYKTTYGMGMTRRS